nr:proline-rich protein 2-like [Aegilops tauschii subsp. strangulata]
MATPPRQPLQPADAHRRPPRARAAPRLLARRPSQGAPPPDASSSAGASRVSAGDPRRLASPTPTPVAASPHQPRRRLPPRSSTACPGLHLARSGAPNPRRPPPSTPATAPPISGEALAASVRVPTKNPRSGG